MSARRVADAEIARQAKQHLIREERYWTRVERNAIVLANEEIDAKEAIIEAVFNLGAGAAVKAENKSLIEDLRWHYHAIKL